MSNIQYPIIKDEGPKTALMLSDEEEAPWERRAPARHVYEMDSGKIMHRIFFESRP